MDKTQIPNKKSQNTKLQYQRELKGWSQEYVAEKIGTTAKNVSRWECGDKPVPYYRQKLMHLFGAKDAAELGFVDQEEPVDEQAHLLDEASVATHRHSSPSLSVVQDYFPEHVVSFEESVLVLPSSTMSMTSLTPVDCGIWFSEKVVRIVGIVNQWRGRAAFCADLQRVLDLELHMFDEVNSLYDPNEYRLSRRNALIVIAALPKSLIGLVQQSQRAWQKEGAFNLPRLKIPDLEVILAADQSHLLLICVVEEMLPPMIALILIIHDYCAGHRVKDLDRAG